MPNPTSTPSITDPNVESETPDSALPDVSVVIVSWNTKALVLEAIDSVSTPSGVRTEVIVIDNNSEDGSADAVAERYPDVRLIRNRVNVGFAAGVNQGIEVATGRYVLLLNSDARVADNTIPVLVHHMDRAFDVAVAGPRVVDEHGARQPSVWQFPSLINLFLSSTYMYKLMAGSRVFDRERLGSVEPSEGAVDAVSGCAFMIRRSVVDEVGAFDADYFMYLEETDFCLRCADAGYQTHYIPAAQVVHLGGQSSKLRRRRNFVEYRRSQLRYFYKHRRPRAAFAARLLLLLWMTIRAPYWLVRALRSSEARGRLGDMWAATRMLMAPMSSVLAVDHLPLVDPSGAAPSSYLVVTPAYNEAEHLQDVVDSMLDQTVPPILWAIVDDGSSDETGDIADRAATRAEWIDVIHAERGSPVADGLQVASEAKAFLLGVDSLPGVADCADLIVKLDADVRFDPDYFEVLIKRFRDDPRLGISGGTVYEPIDGRLVKEAVNPHHVRGATKMYRAECYDVIGGIRPIFGWDVVDELLARSAGWNVEPSDPPALVHLRPTATRDGRLKGWARNGRMARYVGFSPLRMASRATYRLVVRRDPVQAAGLAAGYLSSWIRRTPRLDDDDIRAVVRKHQWKALR